MKLQMIISMFFVPSLVFAQQRTPDPAAQERFLALVARMEDLRERHTIHASGAENPHAAVVRMFFQQGGPPDDVAFAQFAQARYGATGSDTEVLKETRRRPPSSAMPSVDICARILDGSLLDGMSIANYITQTKDDKDRADEAYYQRILDRLSPRVRANVLQRMTEELDGMSSGDLDHLGMAQEDADLYKTMMTSLCRGKKAAAAAPPSSSSPNVNDSRKHRTEVTVLA